MVAIRAGSIYKTAMLSISVQHGDDATKRRCSAITHKKKEE
jgi:hypothetical protein